MRGDDNQQDGMFSYGSPEKRVLADHPLRQLAVSLEGHHQGGKVMKTEILSGANLAESPVSERRSHLRRNVLFSCAELGPANGGIVLDISESGLAFQAIAALTHDELPTIRFQIAPTYSWIDTKARIAWESDSKMVAGVQFIDLPEGAREQIRTWSSLTEAGGVVEEERPRLDNTAQITWAMPVSELISGPAIPNPQTTEVCALNRRQSLLFEPIRRFGSEPVTTGFGKPMLPIAGILLMLLLLAFSSLRPSTNNTTNIQKRPEMAAEPKQADVSSSNSAKSSYSNPRPSAIFAANLPGLVLQVGAMKHEENASALADSLRLINFPVVVSRSGDSTFYRVLVGPYRDVGSTLRVKDRLRQRGFDAFRMPWNPAAQ